MRSKISLAGTEKQKQEVIGYLQPSLLIGNNEVQFVTFLL